MSRRNCLSQPNPQTKGRKSRRENASLSQPTLEQSFSKTQRTLENIEELVNNCVRYILYRAGNKMPIRRPDLQKNVLCNVGKNFDAVMQRVIKILKEVYAYDLYLSGEQTSAKHYLIRTALPYKPVEVENNESLANTQKIAIMLILTHVFMSNNSVSDVSMTSFLKSLQIDLDARHPLFGSVKDLLSQMVKQKYLITATEQNGRLFYSWGSRANHEVSKHALLNFVSKIYKDRNPKSWTTQLESANAQEKEKKGNSQRNTEETETEEA